MYGRPFLGVGTVATAGVLAATGLDPAVRLMAMAGASALVAGLIVIRATRMQRIEPEVSLVRHGLNQLTPLMRAVGAFLLLAGAVALVITQQTLRGIEAVGSGYVLRPLGAVSANSSRAIVWFHFTQTRGVGLAISPECTSTFIVAPILVLGAVLLVRRRISAIRVLTGVLAAAAVIVGGNQARIGVVATLIDHFGISIGYGLGHAIVGSLISLGFVAIAAVVLFRIVTRGATRLPAVPAAGAGDRR
jgi:exosortase/archaeosortase family protein